jgi:hypothetical protein
MDRWLRAIWGVLEEADKGGAGGGDKDKPEDVARKLLEQAKKLITKEGGAESALVTLLEDNKALRERNRTLSEKVPGEGSVVLSKTDAADFETLKALGKPADIKKMVEEHPKLVEFKTTRERTDLVRDAARLMDWSPDVLTDIVNARGLTVEIKSEKIKKEGSNETETVRVPYVKAANATEAVALAAFAKDNLADYMPVLKSKGGNGGGGGDTRRFPNQEGSDKSGGGGDTVAKFIEQQKQRDAKVVNPLRPAAATT